MSMLGALMCHGIHLRALIGTVMYVIKHRWHIPEGSSEDGEIVVTNFFIP
jgi:hypothetical protein